MNHRQAFFLAALLVPTLAWAQDCPTYQAYIEGLQGYTGTSGVGIQVGDGSWADTTGLIPPGVTNQVVHAEDPGDIGTGAEPGEGCVPFTNPDEVAGNIALIRRGVCEFGVKALNAQNAGAVGFIIYQDERVPDTDTTIVNMLGGVQGINVTIPGVFASRATALALLAGLNPGPLVVNMRYAQCWLSCGLSFVGNVTATYTASPRRVTFAGRIANSGAPTTVRLEVDYARQGGGPAGTLSYGPAPFPSTGPNGQPFSVNQPVPANAPAGTYNLTFRLVDVGNGGTICATQAGSVVISAPRTGDGDMDAEFEAGEFSLSAAALAEGTVLVAPNPFESRTSLSFALAEASDVRLAVYDVLGREVAVLVDRSLEAGAHTAVFEAGSLAAGTYVYRLVTDGEVQTGRLTVAR